MRVVGLISGTSYDAIEVAAADFRLDGDTVVLRPIGARSLPYPGAVRDAIASALPPAATTAEAVCRLDTAVGQAFADAADVAVELCGGDADLIASHGQTLYHWVEDGHARGTLQVGQPAWIAERTGLPVVADLRARDVAAGGQGAPLASTFDVLLLGGGSGARAALNLGGIANLTVVAAGRPAVAFDVGPANALLDAAVGHDTSGAETYDAGGRRAGRGAVHAGLLDRLLADPYYDLPPPKSTGKERFNLTYLLAALEDVGAVAADDVLATLAALTAETVARDVARYGAGEVVAAGGGTRNPTLMRLLADRLGHTRLGTIDRYGIPSQAKEAYAFALLGFLTANGLPGTEPGCTGARGARLLGAITPGREPLRLPEPAAAAPQRMRVEGTAP